MIGNRDHVAHQRGRQFAFGHHVNTWVLAGESLEHAEPLDR